MNNFLNYFVEDSRKPRSLKRGLFGSIWGTLSCSGSRERKANKVSTPVRKNENFNFVNLNNPQNSNDDSKNSIRPTKKPKLVNKIAARRHINLFSKERKPSRNGESDRFATTATHTRKNKHKKPYPAIEVYARRRIHINSDKDTYSVGLSTQNQRVLFRTLDDNINL